MTNLEELMEHCVTIARNTIEAGDENLPQWVLQTQDKSIHVMLTPWSNLEEKRNAQLAVLFQMRDIKAVRCVFICEGWCVRTTKEKELDCQPMHHPDRIEVLMVYGEEREQLMLGQKLPATGIHKNFPILRPQNTLGNPTSMEEQGGISEGRFVNIFEKLNKLDELIRKYTN